MSAPQANEAEKNIEIWKVKKLIKRLEAARGNGTSMISLIIRMSSPPADELWRCCATGLLTRSHYSAQGPSFESGQDVG